MTGDYRGVILRNNNDGFWDRSPPRDILEKDEFPWRYNDWNYDSETLRIVGKYIMEKMPGKWKELAESEQELGWA